MSTEADTCRIYIVPKLHSSGWDDGYITEQMVLTRGRIVPIGDRHTRKEGLHPDYMLSNRRNIHIDEQRRIVEYLDSVQERLASLRELQSATGEELSALLPSVLDKAFKGEL